MDYKILSFGSPPQHFRDSVAEYQKRLGSDLLIQILKQAKGPNMKICIKKDTDSAIEQLHKNSSNYTIWILTQTGIQYSTESFAQKLLSGKHLFLLGGQYGLQYDRLHKEFPQAYLLSLSDLTMPYGIAKMVLVEQLYRVWTIHVGKTYHY